MFSSSESIKQSPKNSSLIYVHSFWVNWKKMHASPHHWRLAKDCQTNPHLVDPYGINNNLHHLLNHHHNHDHHHHFQHHFYFRHGSHHPFYQTTIITASFFTTLNPHDYHHHDHYPRSHHYFHHHPTITLTNPITTIKQLG